MASAPRLVSVFAVVIACAACKEASKPEGTAAAPPRSASPSPPTPPSPPQPAAEQHSAQRSYSIACPPTWRAEVEPPYADPTLDAERIRCLPPGEGAQHHACEAERELGDLGKDVHGYRAWFLEAAARGAESSGGKVVTDRVRELEIDGRPAIRHVQRVVSDALSPWSVVYLVVAGETFLRMHCWTEESTVDRELAQFDAVASTIRFK